MSPVKSSDVRSSLNRNTTSYKQQVKELEIQCPLYHILKVSYDGRLSWIKIHEMGKNGDGSGQDYTTESSTVLPNHGLVSAV